MDRYAFVSMKTAIVAVLLFLAMAPAASAQPGSIATVSDINGKVIIQREGADIWEAAGDGVALMPGDSVKSRSDSSAIVRFSGGDYFKLMPLSHAIIDVIDENSGATSNAISLKTGKIWAQSVAEDSSERLIVEAGGTALDITEGSIFVESAGGEACVDVLAGKANARGFSAPDAVEEIDSNTRASLGDGVKSEKNIASGVSDALSESHTCMKESAVPDTQELVRKAIDELGDIIIVAQATVNFAEGDAALTTITESEKSVSAAGDEIIVKAQIAVVFAEDQHSNDAALTFTDEQQGSVVKYVEETDVVVSVSTTVSFVPEEVKYDGDGTTFASNSCRQNGQACGAAADCCTEICNNGVCADSSTTTEIVRDEKNPEEETVVITQTTNVQFECSTKPEITDVSVNGQRIASGGTATIEGGECESEKQAEITWSVAPKCGSLTTNNIKIGAYENSLPGVEEGQKLAQTEQSILFSEDPVAVKFKIADKFGNETTYSINLKFKKHASLSEPPVVTSIVYAGQDVSAGENVSATIDSCDAGSFAIAGTASSKCWTVTSVSVKQDETLLSVSGASEWSAAHTVKSSDAKSSFVVKAKDSSGKESAPVAFNIAYKVSEALLAAPTIEDVTYDAQSIDSGDTVEVEIKDCSPVSPVIKGKATSPCGGAITMSLKKDDMEVAVSGGAEWTAADAVKYTDKTAVYKLTAKGPSGVDSEVFQFSVEPKLDISAPEAETTTIAKTTVTGTSDPLIFFRTDLESGKLEIRGTAASDNSCAVASVEVSTDDGGSWSKAVGTTAWIYSFAPSEGVYSVTAKAANAAGVVSDAGSSVEVEYKATTNEDDLRAAFEKLIMAYKDKQSSDFIALTDDNFSSNYDGLADAQELKDSLDNQSKANMVINLRYSTPEPRVSGDTGTVVFMWTSGSSAGFQFQAIFEFKKDPSRGWLFKSVKDDNTFLRYTSVATGVALSVADNEATADETGAIKLTVTVQDSAGNQIKDGTVVSFTTSLGRVSPSTVETSGGVAEADFFPESKVGTASIYATSGGVKSNTVTVRLLPGVPSSVSITTSSSSMTANGSGSATITATVKDAAGNNVANGTTVTFETTLGTITSSSTTTNGVASATFAGGTVAGSASISADSGSATSNTLTIAVNPGSPASLTLSSPDSELEANGSDSTTLSVSVKDAKGNNVADGTTVTFATSVGTITPLDTTVGGTAEATLTATALGTASVTATSGGVSSNAVTVRMLPGVPSSITIASSTSSVTANGSSSTTITATVRDASNNLVANGTTVTFETTFGTITASSTTTNGVATATFVGGTVPGSASISATSGSASSNSLTVAVNPGPAASLTLSSLDSSLVANGTNTTTLSVDVKDANGNDVADGTVVSFQTTVGTITASDTTVGGTAEATLTATAVGTASVRAVVGSAISNTVTITLLPEVAPPPPGMRKNNSENE